MHRKGVLLLFAAAVIVSALTIKSCFHKPIQLKKQHQIEKLQRSAKIPKNEQYEIQSIESLITIDVKNQKHILTEKNESTAFHCSSGRARYETPKGKYRVYAKTKLAISYKYHNAEMPHTLWFYRDYGIHGSDNVPDHPASHGCVRLKEKDAEWLFQKAPLGTPVVIQ